MAAGKNVISEKPVALSQEELEEMIAASKKYGKLFTVHHHLYASAEYLKKNGIPKSIEDLDKHKIVTFGQAPGYLTTVNWLEHVGRPEGDPRPVALRVNNA